MKAKRLGGIVLVLAIVATILPTPAMAGDDMAEDSPKIGIVLKSDQGVKSDAMLVTAADLVEEFGLQVVAGKVVKRDTPFFLIIEQGRELKQEGELKQEECPGGSCDIKPILPREFDLLLLIDKDQQGGAHSLTVELFEQERERLIKRKRTFYKAANSTEDEMKSLIAAIFKRVQKSYPFYEDSKLEDFTLPPPKEPIYSYRDLEKGLMMAVENGSLGEVRYFIEREANVNASSIIPTKAPGGQYSMTALMTASWFGFTDIAVYLVEKGADLNATGFVNGKSDTSVLGCATLQSRPQLVRFLLEKGADPTHKSRGDWPFMIAACEGDLESTKALYYAAEEQEGKDVINAKNESYTTAIDLAAMRNYPHIVDFLLKEGAVIDDETVRLASSTLAKKLLAISMFDTADHEELTTPQKRSLNIRLHEIEGESDGLRKTKESFSWDGVGMLFLDFSDESQIPDIGETGMTFSIVELPYDFDIGLSFGLGFSSELNRSVISDNDNERAISHLMAYAGASVKYHGWPYPTLSVNWRPNLRLRDLPGESSPVVRLDNVSAEMKIGIFKLEMLSSSELIIPVTATLGYVYYNGKHYPLIGVGVMWWGFI